MQTESRLYDVIDVSIAYIDDDDIAHKQIKDQVD
jgi:hypothetical protein